MSAHDEVGNGKRNRRAELKQGRSKRASNAATVSWDDANWYAVISLTEALSRRGGAVRLGKTRDGGAYALGIYLGDDYATEYIRGAEDFTEAIDEIVRAWIPEEHSNYLQRLHSLSGQ